MKREDLSDNILKEIEQFYNDTGITITNIEIGWTNILDEEIDIATVKYKPVVVKLEAH